MLAASAPAYSISWIVAVATALWVLGVLGEATADAQLQVFKKIASNKGRVCDVGLWRYSRHPNYFFEWIIWCGYGLFAVTTPWGLSGLIAPALMFLLLYFVSGIPLNEAQSLKSKGALYVEYQKRTSKFFPWWPNAKNLE
jgi:steroid 5-alpha reductase family enzyme